ncbi:MAG TPA: 30S ribosomal protein S3 [Firmicutes bacterium]|nr:30S ribosomal protein S3 [Bacillota bacterium]
MGQKVHPKGLRLGVIKDWDSRWFSDDKKFADLLLQDVQVRKFVKSKLYQAGVSRIEIERAANRMRLTIHVAKPGMVIGRGGQGVEELRKEVEQMTGQQVSVNIVEVKNPETDAQLIAENIAGQIERRISFRRAMKQAISRAIKFGAKGCKVTLAGRLGGAEMARRERDSFGSVPLHTLNADVDYGFAEALTTYGKIGIKVWVYKGIIPTLKRTREGGEQSHVNAQEG